MSKNIWGSYELEFKRFRKGFYIKSANQWQKTDIEPGIKHMQQKNIGKERGLQKIKHYCAYQERSHYEVKQKLYGFGLYKNEVEAVLSQLIEENYLNEERYAVAFAGGKFRIKHWGRVKIKYELKQNHVSEYCIKAALNSINDMEYQQTLHDLFETKMKTLKAEKNIFIKKQKVYAYLVQKGFEPVLINSLFNND